ncbi:ankyrin, partial [Tuber magnatum]
AAEGGHVGVVKALLERGDINPNTADTRYGRTPLVWAAGGGHEGVVKALLERGDINPNTADTEYGRTPLSWAARGGHEGIVQLILGRDDVNPDIPDLDGTTPLELAVSRGYTRTVELLSIPKPPFPAPADPNALPEHHSPSPEAFYLPQSPSQLIPSACISPSGPLPPATRPLRGIAIRPIVIISSLIFLFCFLVAISPSFSTTLFPAFTR